MLHHGPVTDASQISDSKFLGLRPANLSAGSARRQEGVLLLGLDRLHLAHDSNKKIVEDHPHNRKCKVAADCNPLRHGESV